MSEDDLSSSRRSYLKTSGALATAGVVGLAGCTQEDLIDDDPTTDTPSDGSGFLSTAVTDQPGDIADFDSCVVTIEGFWRGPVVEESDTEEVPDEEYGEEEYQEQEESDIDRSEGRTYYAFDEPQEADLVELTDDNVQLIDEDRELPVGKYAYLQLDVSGVEGVVDGEQVEVETPGNAPVQFNKHFEIRENTRTTFTADFTPVRRGPPAGTPQGPAQRYLIQPVPDGIEVTYEELEDDDEELEPGIVGDFLEEQNATGYDGEIQDRRGEDNVTVAVGGEEQQFDPPALAITPDTTVEFELQSTSNDEEDDELTENHTVATIDDEDLQEEIEGDFETDFEFDLTFAETDQEQRVFETTGTALFVCRNHVPTMAGGIQIHESEQGETE